MFKTKDIEYPCSMWNLRNVWQLCNLQSIINLPCKSTLRSWNEILDISCYLFFCWKWNISWHAQSLFSRFPPTHTGFPLRTPGGSWQVRVLVWSQNGACVFEHLVQSDHSDHCPFTENKQKIWFLKHKNREQRRGWNERERERDGRYNKNWYPALGFF